MFNSITTTKPVNLNNCPPELNICKNGGICMVINNIDIVCKCQSKFTGEINSNF